MRNHTRTRLWAMTSALVVSGGVFACVGGGGALGDAMTTWDPVPSSLERAESTRESPVESHEVAPPSSEGALLSNEPAPGAQGGGRPGGFDCSGTYTCLEAGKKDANE